MKAPSRLIFIAQTNHCERRGCGKPCSVILKCGFQLVCEVFNSNLNIVLNARSMTKYSDVMYPTGCESVSTMRCGKLLIGTVLREIRFELGTIYLSFNALLRICPTRHLHHSRITAMRITGYVVLCTVTLWITE